MRSRNIGTGCIVALIVVMFFSFAAPIASGQQLICTVQGSNFQLQAPCTVVAIQIFHKAAAQTGTAWLIDQSGNQYGPWNAKIEPDKWTVAPNQLLMPGTYRLVDSDPGTYMGQALIFGA